MDCRVVTGVRSGLEGCGGVHEWIVGLWWGS